ncbi:MAG: 16S rRNA (cytidine(1402)-2'-O)-methyltransferase [Candidatus Thiodiazotropha endolucinida]|uniref:Ribosomal RNA small subunit methyltransferase I n=1 Tax=Candidatus Thiodiazotropha endolucinida TaxID=1655433 RepID=A0A7Z1AHC2_9GAMM|nr:16S rRNA (cytidine(1402)-2'-O)-methyltransferase [Candidatus Thiodiazotropha endolucinida]MBT3012529.1 16S rRNA (cytidine(1402)-2'-O)-methyltransferase [Candidatus Thiodiazotropha sp. (ex Lucina pensylvanica)]MBT3017781.1 16S rRNA (cytidine(1402)-2'-O)-methyltransferase [Candidatus Thiodiazotropha taylori]MBT3038889.1 16S rRNA (cytidine(1402)-2'-O)-methyltransferase [Candidatus Thiodiazotropha sp. (ex Codakia orbicularis)]MBT3031961.1 16S rRNA (cytidine(1402)-2'-O)-methyltransferase [Candida
MSKGVLYVVATPIGNIEDISQRALETLKQVDFIAAEDTRHTRPLLKHYGINTPLRAFHQYNEHAKLEMMLQILDAGQSIALVSDAGTPLISDPGFPLVRELIQRGGRVVPVPGASALICALSASGLPTDRFMFLGFPPRQTGQRLAWLQTFADEVSTLVFYESSHRVADSVAAMCEVFGSGREGVIARELTKLHETILRGSLESLSERLRQDRDQQKGEFVILIRGATGDAGERIEVDIEQMLITLMAELPLKQAVSLASRVSGIKKNILYKQALKISGG